MGALCDPDAAVVGPWDRAVRGNLYEIIQSGIHGSHGFGRELALCLDAELIVTA